MIGEGSLATMFKGKKASAKGHRSNYFNLRRKQTGKNTLKVKKEGRQSNELPDHKDIRGKKSLHT